jgi:hypothetical protein
MMSSPPENVSEYFEGSIENRSKSVSKSRNENFLIVTGIPEESEMVAEETQHI